MKHDSPLSSEIADLIQTLDAIKSHLEPQVRAAKDELVAEAKHQGKVAAAFGIAAALAFAGLLVLLATGVALWTYVIPLWAGALIMSVVALVGAAGAAAYAIGRARAPKLDRSRQMLREDIESLRAGSESTRALPQTRTAGARLLGPQLSSPTA